MLVHRLQNSKGQTEALTHQPIGVRGRFRVGQRHIFIFDAVSTPQQRHGEIGIFRNGVDVIPASFAHGRNTPGANCARHHAHRT